MNVRFGSLADLCGAKGMSALPPKADMCSALAMSAKCQKRTSANKLRSCPTCFSWAVLQALELADDARITFTIALHGKHAREMLVEDSHRYHSISHGIIRTTGKMPSRPSPRASEGGRSRQSPLECCHHWALSSAYFVAFTGRFIHGNEVSPGNLCRELAAVA